MRKAVLLISFSFTVIFMLTSCGGRADEFIFEQAERVPQEIVDAGHLQGEFTILSLFSFSDLNVYVHLFNQLHPDVNIVQEVFPMGWDSIADITALTTRLLSNPPDMLVFAPQELVFEKMHVEAVFHDLYAFFYGQRGIDTADYFTNIFNALETRGGLFHVPLYVSPHLTLLNRELFDAIGVDWSAITTMTVEESMEFFLSIRTAMPDTARLRLNETFSMWQMMENMQLYDVAQSMVFVDTPHMHGLVEQAMEIYFPNTPRMRFMPSHKQVTVVGGSVPMFAQRLLTGQSVMQLTESDEMALLAMAYFLQSHPDMQFSQPVVMARGEAGALLEFTSYFLSFSLLRNAPNSDLAWEFLRFMLEYDISPNTEEIPASVATNYIIDGFSNFVPINRQRFQNQFGGLLAHIAEVTHAFTDLGDHVTMPIDDYMRQQVSSALAFYEGIMEMLNYEVRTNAIVLTSLVYPDIWLLYSGQQSIAQTLANIQNRLELYVSE